MVMNKLAFLMHKNFEGRFRVKEFIPFFEKNGVRVSLLRVPNRPLERLKIFRALQPFDVVIIQRKLLTPLDLFFVRRYANRIIFDFDDAIMYRSSRHKYQVSHQRMGRFAHMMKSVDAVTAGNTYLAEQAARFIDPDRIFIVPTVVDVTEYALKDYERDSDGFVVGWIGSSSTLHYLNSIAPAIQKAAQRIKNLKLKIVCDRFIDIDGVDVIKKPWRPQDVSHDLTSFDVGVMPISDDPWTRGKCGFKIVQYLAAGVPAIASPVGINRDLVVPGQTGFWAEGMDDWEERFVQLAGDKKLRIKMGRAGRRLVEERYSLQETAPRYFEILKTVQKMKRSRS
jgi:glycosyltransferase involved in cell wall biosynthesis